MIDRFISEKVVFTDNQIKEYIKEFNEVTEKNSIILILCTSTIIDVLVYTLSLRNNNVIILYSERNDLSKIISLLDKFKVNYIWSSQNIINQLSKLRLCKNKITINNFSLCKVYSTITYRGDTNLILLSTSGTIGMPKLVMLDYNNIYFNSLSIIESLKLNSSSVSVLKLPIYNAFGLSIVNSTLLSNGNLIIPFGECYDKTFWDFCRNSNANFYYGVPYSFMLIQKFGLYNIMWNSVEACAVAGGHFHQLYAHKYAHEAIKLNKRFYIMYGQTEATARMSCICNEEIILHPNSVGKAISGGLFKIINSEIYYYGKNIFKGYAKDYNDLNNTINNTELNTHDIGYLDKEDYLYILGRSDRLIKFFGNRIQLEDIEKSLSEKFFNYTFAVVYFNNIFYIFTDFENEAKIMYYLLKETIIPSKFIKIFTNYAIPRLTNNKVDYLSLKKEVVID